MKTAKDYEGLIHHLRYVSGTVMYEITFRGKDYYVRNHDTLSYDRIRERDYVDDNAFSHGMTYKQALMNLYNYGKPKKTMERR